MQGEDYHQLDRTGNTDRDLTALTVRTQDDMLGTDRMLLSQTRDLSRNKAQHLGRDGEKLFTTPIEEEQMIFDNSKGFQRTEALRD